MMWACTPLFGEPVRGSRLHRAVFFTVDIGRGYTLGPGLCPPCSDLAGVKVAPPGLHPGPFGYR